MRNAEERKMKKKDLYPTIENIFASGMPNHHNKIRQSEWKNTLRKLELDVGLNIVEPERKQEFIEKQQYVIELWKKTWNFALVNDINLFIMEDKHGGITDYIGALYGDWHKWSWKDDNEKRRKEKTIIEFNTLFNETITVLTYLENRFFHIGDIDELNEHEIRMHKIIIELIDKHFEPERKRIRDTIVNMTPQGVSCCVDIIWSYCFCPLDKRFNEISPVFDKSRIHC